MHIRGLAHLIFVLIVAVGAVNLNEGTEGRINRPVTTISTKLVHRDSVISPPLSMDSSDDDLRAQTLPKKGKGVFLVNVSIGQPPLPQLLVMDTGTSLTVVRPADCDGCEDEVMPLYDPLYSSTFEILNCSSKYCIGLGVRCDFVRRCVFMLRYGDSREGYANLASETFTFLTSDDGFVNVPNIPFGYVLSLEWSDLPGTHGILGLGPNLGSLGEIYSKFSYCIGSVTDPFNPNNLLVIGEMARLEGFSTPMETYGHYSLTLKGISVGDNGLDIMPEALETKMIIDSGSTVTYLMGDAYEQLKKEIKRVLEGKMHLFSDRLMCYDGDLRRDFKDFPLVTLHFGDEGYGANLVLEAASLFRSMHAGMSCLAITKVSPETGGVPILGMLAQQNYNIGYDLSAKKLWIERIECRFLQD